MVLYDFILNLLPSKTLYENLKSLNFYRDVVLYPRNMLSLKLSFKLRITYSKIKMQKNLHILTFKLDNRSIQTNIKNKVKLSLF